MTDYSKVTITWALQNDDWSDLTVDQIAEVLGVTSNAIHCSLSGLRKRGVVVTYKKKQAGRPKEI